MGPGASRVIMWPKGPVAGPGKETEMQTAIDSIAHRTTPAPDLAPRGPTLAQLKSAYRTFSNLLGPDGAHPRPGPRWVRRALTGRPSRLPPPRPSASVLGRRAQFRPDRGGRRGSGPRASLGHNTPRPKKVYCALRGGANRRARQPGLQAGRKAGVFKDARGTQGSP